MAVAVQLESGPAPDARFYVRVKHAAPLPVNELGPGDFMYGRAQNAHAVRRRVLKALGILSEGGEQRAGHASSYGGADAGAPLSQGSAPHATIHAIGAAIEPAMQLALEIVARDGQGGVLSLTTTTSSVTVADEWIPREGCGAGVDVAGVAGAEHLEPITRLRHCSAIHLRISKRQ